MKHKIVLRRTKDLDVIVELDGKEINCINVEIEYTDTHDEKNRIQIDTLALVFDGRDLELKEIPYAAHNN